MQLLATGLFNYVWPFSGHQVLKDYLTVFVLEFENDPVLAAVLAQSQQEYLDSLSRGHTDSNSECPPTVQEN